MDNPSMDQELKPVYSGFWVNKAPGYIPGQVVKFGGTSIKTPERIRQAINLVQQIEGEVRRVVVVSALGGATDQLLEAIDLALTPHVTPDNTVAAIQRRHEQVVNELTLADEKAALFEHLRDLWGELDRLLRGIDYLSECTPRTRDAVLSLGERASAPIIASAFRAAGEHAFAVDARTLIRTDDTYGEANVDFETSTHLIQRSLQDMPQHKIAVVTGFISTATDGSTTTLGRSGSDFTATILGRALRTERVVIWTDVDGVLSADPRDVPEAFPLARLSYTEAAEMAYFGARVLHPRTMRPVQELGIPLLIKNTLNPDAPGTLISAESRAVDLRVKAISTVRDVAVVMLEGNGMLGVPGIAARLFVALAEANVNVLMIAQASSEHSICLVVRQTDMDLAVETLRLSFQPHLARGDISRIYAIPRCAVVSSVGDRMRHHPGLAGRMFATLGRSRVNVLSIAQGAAETNISAVVRDDEVKRAVRALHEAFPLARLRAHICLFGPGRVGAKLLEMIARQHDNLLDRVKLNLRLVGLANSQYMLWNADGLPFETAVSELKNGREANLDWLLEQLGASRLERVIVVDTTASAAVAQRYPEFLELGLGVVTANKLANTRDMQFYRRLQRAARRREVAYRYETTAGAGLPVISTLKDLVRTGDTIHRIEGIFSGTLAYVFNSLDHGGKFSEIVRNAHNLGYTEPDPSDDLSGEDVARKLLILARELGLDVERSDIKVESLLPEGFASGSPSDLFTALERVDADWQARVEEATANNQRLRYIGRVEKEQLSVGVQAVRVTSPFARPEGRENVITFQTDRYMDTPMVIQGPGAGLGVTSAGLLSDLILAAELMP
ncbi:MAG: bifunctional aspartate kinase/homoserine dehydrogenase I [Bacteroidota bacterium]|nr:bifunctional aspartate kinase/homoserine dehydrogenase I [Bacteroidota bacterium]